MTTRNESRPDARGGSQATHIHTATVPPSPDLTEHLQTAARMIRLLDDQRREVQQAEERAYRRGWSECADACYFAVTDAWEAGYAAAEADMDAAWKPVARAVRRGAEKAFPTWKQKRAAELEACKPRPGDFPGLDNDPHCLDRYRTSVVSVGQPQRRAA